MALIRSADSKTMYYIWVEQEQISSTVSATAHPVESGVVLTDHVGQEPQTLQLSGCLVENVSGAPTGSLAAQGVGAKGLYDLLRSWQKQGMPIFYVGRTSFSSAIIESLSTTYTSEGGPAFDMTIREIRIAKSVYKTKKFRGVVKIAVRGESGNKRVITLSKKKERYYTIKKGQTIKYIAAQYKENGVTVKRIKSLNKDRSVFRGKKGDFTKLKIGAKLLLGVW